MLRTFLPFMFVGVGSMAGGMSRYGLTLITQNVSAFTLPFGTLISNLAGCLVTLENIRVIHYLPEKGG